LAYDFEIIYKKGKKNVVADALSRKDEYVEAFLYAILIIQPDWIIEAGDEWKNDEKVWTLIQRLQQDSSASDTFTWKNDSLWYKDCLYLCKNSQLKQKILLELHTSPVSVRSHSWIATGAEPNAHQFMSRINLMGDQMGRDPGRYHSNSGTRPGM
jgi:hypothetical protein